MKDTLCFFIQITCLLLMLVHKCCFFWMVLQLNVKWLDKWVEFEYFCSSHKKSKGPLPHEMLQTWLKTLEIFIVQFFTTQNTSVKRYNYFLFPFHTIPHPKKLNGVFHYPCTDIQLNSKKITIHISLWITIVFCFNKNNCSICFASSFTIFRHINSTASCTCVLCMHYWCDSTYALLSSTNVGIFALTY